MAAIPFWARTSDRVAKDLPETLSCEKDKIGISIPAASNKMAFIDKVGFEFRESSKLL